MQLFALSLHGETSNTSEQNHFRSLLLGFPFLLKTPKGLVPWLEVFSLVNKRDCVDHKPFLTLSLLNTPAVFLSFTLVI